MTNIISVKVYKAGRLDSLKFRRAMSEPVPRLTKGIRESFKATCATWRHQPVWDVDVTETPQTIRFTVATADRIYYWLDQGTKVRYATMSRDWISKTRPAIGWGAAVFMTPGHGRGRMLFVSRRHPRPGIKPRLWSVALTRRWRDEIKSEFELALLQFAQDSGHRLQRRGGSWALMPGSVAVWATGLLGGKR